MTINLGEITLEKKLVTEDLSLLEITLLPGANSGLHRHTRERETFVVLEGEILFLINGVELRASAGEVVTLEPNLAHRFSNVSANLARAYLVLNPGGLVRYFEMLTALLKSQASPQQIQQLGRSYGLEFFD